MGTARSSTRTWSVCLIFCSARMSPRWAWPRKGRLPPTKPPTFRNQNYGTNSTHPLSPEEEKLGQSQPHHFAGDPPPHRCRRCLLGRSRRCPRKEVAGLKRRTPAQGEEARRRPKES